MREKKTIYGILRVSNRITEDHGVVHMYSCVSSNKDTLRKYAKRIAKSYERDSKVYIVEKEKGEKEVEKYLLHLQDILNFANIVNNAPVEGLDITIGANEAKNRFRRDEVKVFDNIEGLLQNAPEQDRHMFKIPKVLN